MPTSVNEQLIHAYLKIVATGNYENFGTLLTDDCTFSLMPSGHTFKGRKDIMFPLTTTLSCTILLVAINRDSVYE